MASAKHLNEERLRALHAAAVRAGLTAHRAELLLGIDPDFTSGFPVAVSPSAQLLSDLFHLADATLRDNSIPLIPWLRNALGLVGSHELSSVFENTLQHLGQPVPERSATRARAPSPAAAAARTDVVVLTALQDELTALLELGEGGRDGWEEKRDLSGFRYFRHTFPRKGGGVLTVAAAWIGAMGVDVDTALRGQKLVEELDPGCLAMCGICSGWRKKVALGDIVVADKLYTYDHGKLIAGDSPESGFYHDIATYSLDRVWAMDAALLGRAVNLGALVRERPLSLEQQRWWLLQAIHAHERDGAEAPDKHPDRKARCPAWKRLVPRLRDEGLLTLAGGKLALTKQGRAALDEHLIIHLDGPASEPALQVHVGAMATGRTAREDPDLFDRLARHVRTTLAVDMEGAAVAQVADGFGKRSIVVKAVSDHADHDKDATFRAFACKASASFLLAFLQEHLPFAPAPMPPRSRGSRFLDRVEDICRLREPGAILTRHEAPHPFAGVLEVVVPKKPVVRCELVAALEQPLSEALLSCFVQEVLPSYYRDSPGEVKLVHLAPAAPPDLVRWAFHRRIELVTFDTYQALIDFSRYCAWLSNRLDTDLDYPPWLYVEQPADIGIGGQPPVPTESTLDCLCDLLATSEPRFALVLGKFGAGKTFLLREVARRLLERGPLVPILVEMRFLEKESSLRSLLSQHFGSVGAGHVDLDAFLYMLRAGKVVLLFDGFDELAVRVTYDRVLHYFSTILEAVGDRAKVVVSSRTEHFLDDQQIKKELAKRADEVQGYRLIGLRDFKDEQVWRFLKNRLKDDAEAEARHALIRDVHDLLGLSENPRMLSFIAELEKEILEAARQAEGEISPATLYALLLERWLARESKQADVTLSSLWAAVRRLARTLWAMPGQVVELGAMPRELIPSVEGPLQRLSPEEARNCLASRSLLKRDAAGMFSFVHRTVLEWLVADEAARELEAGGEASVLAAEAMSPLMARFFVQLANRKLTEVWAREVFAKGGGGHAERNALKVAKELGVAIVANLEGRDLRGESLGGLNLFGANLRNANLEGLSLSGREFSGATLAGARLVRADLQRAILKDADLTGADLALANLTRADLADVKLVGARMLGAKLLGARGLSAELCASLAREGAAVVDTGAGWEVMPSLSRCNAVAFHPGGHLVVTGYLDGAVGLWDPATGILLRTLQGHKSLVLSAAFSPDGRTLACGALDTTVRLWDSATGTLLGTLQGHQKSVLSVAFSPDGRTLASGSDDTTVGLWDPASGARLHTLQGHEESVLSVAFSPDGRALASGSADTTVRLWDSATGTLLGALQGHQKSVLSVAFSPDGRTLASGSDDTTVELWDPASGARLRTLAGRRAWVLSVAFSPDGRTLASGSEDATVELWDPTTGARLRTLQGHDLSVRSMAFSPDGRTLASGSDDTTVELWDSTTGARLRTLQGYASWVMSVAFSSDGCTLAAGSEDTTVGLWDPATGARLRKLHSHNASVLSVAFSPDGHALASGSEDTTVGLWDPVTGARLRKLYGHKASVLSVAFSPDGHALASGSEDKTVGLWDPATGARLRTLRGHTSWVLSVAFSPDGRSLASGSDDTTVALWDRVTGARLRTLQGHKSLVLSVAFSSDGRLLASGSSDNTVGLWDPATGAMLRMLQGHKARVLSMAFSPDGRALASGAHDKTVGVWDPATGTLLRMLRGHTGSVLSVAFSPDGRALASGSSDNTIRLWEVATGRCLAVLLGTPEGWVAFIPDGPRAGAFKLGGDIAGSFWHVIGLARFEPGELDEFLPDDRKLRLPDDYRFLPG
jgi:WD40 repeat protein/nucleoside phosphorylase